MALVKWPPPGNLIELLQQSPKHELLSGLCELDHTANYSQRILSLVHLNHAADRQTKLEIYLLEKCQKRTVHSSQSLLVWSMQTILQETRSLLCVLVPYVW